MRRDWRFLGVVLGAAIAITSSMRATQAQNDLKIYNWSDYINPAVLDAFTRETGIRVIYDTYDQKEQVEATLKGGKSGYDLVVVDAATLSRDIPLKLFAPLDRTLLANLSHLSPEIIKRLARHDPENRHAVNYLWGTTGLAYNVKKIRERLGPEAKVESWSILFNPEILKKLAPCGVHMLDAPEELFPAALRYLGLDPDSRKEADWRRVTDLLLKIRPHIQKFHSSEFIGALANGDICLAVGTSGDVMQARRRAMEAKNGIEIGYAIPREGALIWFDNLVIPTRAENKEAAHLFINFLNRPEIAALNAGLLPYASPNLAAHTYLPAIVRDDRSLYPPAEVLSRLYTVTALDEPSQRARSRLWQRIKGGK
ncbi:MAG: polyamine ABC transporter substrate-binding protein [Rhabdaerophilum sp.]